MTTLNRLFTLAEGRGQGRVPLTRVCLPIRSDVLAQADEMAEEIGLSRAVVLREAIHAGVASLYAEWESAVQAGKEREKAEKSQQKLKFGGSTK